MNSLLSNNIRSKVSITLKNSYFAKPLCRYFGNNNKLNKETEAMKTPSNIPEKVYQDERDYQAVRMKRERNFEGKDEEAQKNMGNMVKNREAKEGVKKKDLGNTPGYKEGTTGTGATGTTS